ncbi:unnamed protein product [Allacma fusca]|uniref:ABC transporter domain-containing protein n=1 Tax=Allacma fusca TaxID=39272 RepID=A0A8J2Q6R6_9HEXA|nr:unnamed protein product [Allacma fusca]
MSQCQFYHQLKLLLWKNFLIRRRQKKRLFIEFFWPLMLFLVLCWVRSQALATRRPDCHLVPKALPSVGGFEFIQNYICSFANPCFDYDIEDEEHWKEAPVNKYTSRFIKFMEIYLKDPDLIDLIRDEMVNLSINHQKNQSPGTVRQQPLPSSPDSPLVSKGNEIQNFLCGEFQGSILADLTEAEFDFDALEDLSFLPNPGMTIKDPGLSKNCRVMFAKLHRYRGTSLVWKTLKHFIRGWILFAPNNSYTDQVMMKVDEKIKELQQGAAVMKSFESSFTSIRDWAVENTDDVETIKKVFADDALVDKILSGWNVTDVDDAAHMRDMLKLFAKTDTVESLNILIELTKEVQKFIQCFRFDKRVGYETEKEAVEAAALLQSSNMVWAVVVFEMDEHKNATLPDPLTIKIRMDISKVDKTNVIQDRKSSRNRPRRQPFKIKYITYGFTYLQEMVERAAIEVKTGKLLDQHTSFIQQYPFPCHVQDFFLGVLALTFPLLMTVSWIYSAAMIIKSIVYEREHHLKEMMKIMGLPNAVMWLGWLIDSFMVLSLSATMLSALLKFGNILPYSDFTLIWVFMISYSVSVICLSFLMSTFFSRANSAAAAGGIGFFLLYLPYNFFKLWLDRDALSWYHVLPFCLISNIAFGLGCSTFVELEKDGVGALWESLNSNTDDFDLRYSISMLWFDSFLYFALTLYIEVISPASAGIPKPWYFLFQPSTYIKRSKLIANNSNEFPVESTLPIQSSANTDHTCLVEPVPDHYISGVKVIGLGKTFPNGRIALKNLNIEFYENQITSFLGHNGAGKTTTVSILTGIYPPSKGTAFVNGYEIMKDMDSARKNLGVCPQYNVLFSRLTVAEHLTFFSGLKGKDRQVSAKEIEVILDDLRISEKGNDYPSSLSGGMKRKLCVGIAFCGRSKTVFLDEPTAGVDPYSRRSIWELLLKYKQGRTIILTTHFMDEADILGDRIAIISNGTLKAAGSSLEC